MPTGLPAIGFDDLRRSEKNLRPVMAATAATALPAYVVIIKSNGFPGWGQVSVEGKTMTKFVTKLSVIAVTAVLLGACAGSGGVARGCHTQNSFAGSAVGAAGGAAIGLLAGGNATAIAAGGLLGGATGAVVGSQVGCGDEYAYRY
ncbi:MAG: hypothetical protein H6842_01570 [Rhodospirillaceae bacterium]|nr:hypothetical protein [Rhodospirillaceae bacterium]